MVKMRNFTLFAAAFAAVFLLAATFSTCESTLGFGNAIDFVLPELTLDPGPNPQYVTYTSTISGKITDNIAVDRVELREALSGKKLFTAHLSGSNPLEKRWTMVLDFRTVTLDLQSGRKVGEELNGERIGVEIVGYDKAGNSHIAAITLIIDMREPFTTDIEIERTSIGNKRIAHLEPLFPNEKEDGLKILETTDLIKGDPKGERSENADRYQNGRFTINAKLDESETRIEDDLDNYLRLNIYDEEKQNEPLLSLPRKDGTSVFSPVWPLLDEDIIAAGTAKGWTKAGISYADAYHSGKRFYYRVEIVATDRSGNELHDDLGYFCMWQDGDIPKGVLDPNFAGDGQSTSYVDRGESLPVVFFDDDAIEYAYAGLLTKAQWEGQRIPDVGPVQTVYIAPGVVMPQYTNLPVNERDDAKLAWLRDRLRSNPPQQVYNWRNDIRHTTSADSFITATVNSPSTDTYEAIIYVETGNQESDYGEFVLFTLTADRKLPPHDPAYNGPIETLKPQWKGRAWKIQVIDSNAPLIVFDTVDTTDPEYNAALHPGNDPDIPGAATGNSPEENTFPRLSDGRNFEINGYTLRENGNGHNSVTVFRLAWIPFKIKDGVREGPDAFIAQVQNALSSPNYPEPDPLDPDNSTWPEGVQHWELHNSEKYPIAAQAPYRLIEGSPQPINSIDFRKQVFRKKFDVLGGPDDRKPEYLNFTYKGVHENETKVLVFYAKDNARHGVFRQLRLLGNKSPPVITVYDLTNRSVNIIEGPSNGLPDLNNDVYPSSTADRNNYYFFNTSSGLIDTAGRTRYETRRLWYQPTGFNLLKAIAMPDNTLLLEDSDIATTNAAYPRETIIKYWVAAKSNGDLAVKNVLMHDITFSNNLNQVGHYDGNISLSYVEKVSEITQRVFLFEATDSLNNTARIQRTVAVTNAAVLNSITTTTQTGSYGIGQTITLQANFSNLVRWTGTNPPLLNVRFNYGGTSQLRQIPTSTLVNTASLSLAFPITVAENDTGVIETIYFGIPNSNGHTAAGTEAAGTNRPITIPAGTSLLDASRGDSAFTPRNSAGFDWTTNKGSLQASKTITLQGVRPVRTNFTLTSIPSGKTRYTDSYPGLFYKADETLEFTLTANTQIFTGSVAPVIQFQVNNGTWYNAPWARAGATSSQMIFSVLVNAANVANNGGITGIRLNDARSIVDSVGNAFTSGSAAITISANGQVRIENYTPPTPAFTGNVSVTIDKVVPGAPPTTLNGTAVTTSTATLYYNVNPVLAITDYTANFIPTGETAPVTTQYSLNNGVTWRNFPTQETALGWTTTGSAANTLNISSGEWTLVTRFTDRAGNEGAVVSRPLDINVNFPNLIAVAAVQSNGWYKAGSNLSFTLDFAAVVNVNTGSEAQVQIVLTNRGSTATTDGSGNNNMILQAAAGQTSITRTGNTTITFNWNGITNKEMRNGMYISRINLSGLRDRFGNSGAAAANITYNASTTAPSPIGSTSGPFANPRINNLGIGVKVDAINPTRSSTTPATDGVAAANNSTTDRRNRITLTFNEPVIKGSGIITVKPETGFLIPPVFENDGYYLEYDSENRAATAGNTRSYVAGFYDIYNSGLTAAQRNALTEGTTTTSQTSAPTAGTIPSSATDNSNPSMSRLRLNNRTGQSYGPYIRTTHGLTPGNGYTGNYSGTNYTNGPNTNQAGTSHMIPDTATKWVLDYQYSITGSDAAVTNIRAALKAAKFRQQEIDISSSNVSISGSTVTIILNEPLLQGLQWELSYPATAFTDEAGNAAPGQAEDNYKFWSPGAQKPVIRVDRKSYDARTSNWHVPTTNNNANGYTHADPAAPWSLASFNTVAYRIESETPGASIYYGVSTPANSTSTAGTGAFDAVTVTPLSTGGAPEGTIPNQSGDNFTTGITWQGISSGARVNQWVRPNLINRGGNGNGNNQNRYTVNGLERASGGQLRLLRSYNRDATQAALNGLVSAEPTGTAASTTSAFTGSFTFGALEAGKRYVAAVALKTQGGTNHYSARGYEGVFRTMIVMNGQTNNGNTAQDRIVVEGSNIKNGMPSVAGFPVQDAAESGDSRFIKMMYNNGGTTFFTWVSTEIVCEWYFIYFGGGGSHAGAGEVNNYLMVGYGDLTYAYNVSH